jgi:hypothetical protein
MIEHMLLYAANLVGLVSSVACHRSCELYTFLYHINTKDKLTYIRKKKLLINFLLSKIKVHCSQIVIKSFDIKKIPSFLRFQPTVPIYNGHCP